MGLIEPDMIYSYEQSGNYQTCSNEVQTARRTYSRIRAFARACDAKAPISSSDWSLAGLLFVVILLGFTLLAFYTSGNWPLTGDEPHYLAIAESIWQDRDLDLSNNSAYCAIDPHVQVTEAGKWRPTHMVGLPVLLAVPWALGGRVGAGLTMAIVSAATVGLTYLLAWQITGQRRLALLSALTLAIVPPFSVYATMLYPEVPGALLAVTALVALYQAGDRPAPYLVLGLAAAAMPWFVIRFAPVSALVVALILPKAISSARPTRNISLTLITCFVSAILYLAYNYYLYGSWSPLASYGAQPAAGHVFLIGKWLRSLVGWLFDQRAGLFAIAPVFLFAAPGLWHLMRQPQSRAFPLILCASVSLLFGIVLPGFWVQWSPPTRYAVIALPVLAIGVGQLAFATRSLAIRAVLIMTTLVSFALGGVIYARPWLAYNSAFSVSQLFDALPKSRGMSVTDLIPLLDSAKTFKDKRFPEEQLGDKTLGRVLYFAGVEGLVAQGGSVVADPGAHYSYATQYGPDATDAGVLLSARTSAPGAKGSYEVTVRLRTADASGKATRSSDEVRISVLPGNGEGDITPLSLAVTSVSELDEEYSNVTMEFELDEPQPFAINLEYDGQTTLLIDSIKVSHTPSITQGWGLLCCWLLSCAVLGLWSYRSLPHGSDEGSNSRVISGHLLLCAWAFIMLVVVYGSPFAFRTWRFDGEAMRRQTGGIRLDRHADNFLATATRDQGFLAYGPYTCVNAGQYVATFRVYIEPTPISGQTAATLEVARAGGTAVLASYDMVATSENAPAYSDIRLEFQLDEPAQLEVRLLATGVTEVRLDYVDVVRVDAG